MNPFRYGRIAYGDYFYDRKEELARITSTIKGGNNVVLFAPRRYGKTSLVFKVMEVLEAEGAICIYFDCSTAFSLESFADLFVRAVAAKQNNWQRFLSTLSGLGKTLRPSVSLDESGLPQLRVDFTEPKMTIGTLADILDLPEKLSEDTAAPVLVVFDEFQDIQKFNKYGLENILRNKIQQQHRVNYLFLGSKTHILSDMFNNKNRAFYNSSYHFQLSKLPEQETIAFLKDRFSQSSIIIGDVEAQQLIGEADNIPYYIQLLASEVWQYTITDKAAVTPEIIRQCAQQIVIVKDDYYNELFGKLSETQCKLLIALTKEQTGIFSSAYIRKYHLRASSSVQKAAAALVEEGIVDKEAGSYYICDPFFKRYIIQTFCQN